MGQSMSEFIKVQIIDKGVQEALSKLSRSHKPAVMNALETAGTLIRSKAIENINSGGRSGRTYKRGKKGYHVASAPGEFPATDSGALVKDISVERLADSVTIGSRKEPHGYFLEFGTVKMGARPWLRPSAKQEEKNINRLLDTMLGDLLRGL